jgi:AraC-like DNA-binding protein
MTGYPPRDPAVWRPQRRFAAPITSRRQLQLFNDRGGISVNFDTLRSAAPNIVLTGSQSETLSLWETHSPSGFITQPKFDARLVTVRFVTSGRTVYRRRCGTVEGLPTHATLVDFDDLLEVEASDAFSAVSGTFGADDLRAAQAALTGYAVTAVPSLAPTAALSMPGMRALFLSLRQARLRIQDVDRHDDLIFPLIQEVLSYQLLSAWPQCAAAARPGTTTIASRSLRAAVEYIEAHLSEPLTLAEIAAVADVSVRSLQDRFRQEKGRTPVQFIIEQRLARAHADLISPGREGLSIAAIARRWGFVHMGDFAQRYRRRYGCTPTETRRDHGRHDGN